MKRIAILWLMLFVAISIEAAVREKTCNVCGGTGHVFGRSDIQCQGCNGRGRVPLSEAELRREAEEAERYGQNANDLMDAYNLSPEEYFAYEELVKQAMQQMPVYQNCSSCGGTGNCSMCGGYMNLSLDGDLCLLCGGSGVCPACRGARQIVIGYQDNPNKEMLIQQANAILNHGQQQRGNNNHYDTRQNADYTSGDHYDNDSQNESDLDENNDDDNRYQKKHGTSPIVYILIGVCLAIIIGWLGRRIFKK